MEGGAPQLGPRELGGISRWHTRSSDAGCRQASAGAGTGRSASDTFQKSAGATRLAMGDG